MRNVSRHNVEIDWKQEVFLGSTWHRKQILKGEGQLSYAHELINFIENILKYKYPVHANEQGLCDCSWSSHVCVCCMCVYQKIPKSSEIAIYLNLLQ